MRIVLRVLGSVYGGAVVAWWPSVVNYSSFSITLEKINFLA